MSTRNQCAPRKRTKSNRNVTFYPLTRFKAPGYIPRDINQAGAALAQPNEEDRYP
jgi:hypothetical protein